MQTEKIRNCFLRDSGPKIILSIQVAVRMKKVSKPNKTIEKKCDVKRKPKKKGEYK